MRGRFDRLSLREAARRQRYRALGDRAAFFRSPQVQHELRRLVGSVAMLLLWVGSVVALGLAVLGRLK